MSNSTRGKFLIRLVILLKSWKSTSCFSNSIRGQFIVCWKITSLSDVDKHFVSVSVVLPLGWHRFSVRATRSKFGDHVRQVPRAAGIPTDSGDEAGIPTQRLLHGPEVVSAWTNFRATGSGWVDSQVHGEWPQAVPPRKLRMGCEQGTLKIHHLNEIVPHPYQISRDEPWVLCVCVGTHVCQH